MPGVEIHAQVLETVFGKTALTTPHDIIAWEILGTLLVGLLIVILGPLLGATTLGVAGAVLAVGTVGLSWYFFDQKRILLDATFPLVSTFSVYAVLVFANYMREQADRQQIRSMFGQYLSPILVGQMVRNPEKVKLGGEDRRITVLFSDIRGFTTISERFKSDPQGLVTLMNRFLTPLTNAIIEHKGYIDKYMGDAIMAFWNAPLDDPEHETNACLAALEMLDRLAVLNEERQREAEATGQTTFPLRAGIGMNSGLALVGNMGSTEHLNYSALGDTVNLASRIEGQTVNYGVSIVVGATTAEAAKASVATVEIDYVAVKGKSEPEHVYAVLGRADMLAAADFRAFRTAHTEMMEHYRHARFADAKAALNAQQQSYDAFGLTRLVELYRERIAEYEVQPPPPGWDGSLKLETK
jgi:adenylate cyclase